MIIIIFKRSKSLMAGIIRGTGEIPPKADGKAEAEKSVTEKLRGKQEIPPKK